MPIGWVPPEPWDCLSTVFEGLLKQVDVFVHGYRPGALAGLGYDQANPNRTNPALMDVSPGAYGWQGPWVLRRGFDSLVQCSSGITDICRNGNGRLGELPEQALDQQAGHLLAACVFEALR
ncbi:MAG: hypothetical protein CSB44_12020 [Gammaproteobacteria bacterium]|nr:MAG: hypothetical protein CSB44_12020 [Gammaproteobacteria bacterium]